MAGVVHVDEATAADVALARTLFEEDADELGLDLGFQGFERDCASYRATTRPHGAGSTSARVARVARSSRP